MFPTIKELLKDNTFDSLKLIAGKEGLSRNIKSVGILDYEFDQSFKGKYLYSNFTEDQLVLTSFLYAKNNPYLILDAVKFLISKNASGLAIKNVFKLPIHENIIRYANSKNFPIFVFEDNSMFFENIIVTANNFIENYKAIHYKEHQTNDLLHLNLSDSEIIDTINKIDSSLYQKHFVMYFTSEQSLDISKIKVYQDKLNELLGYQHHCTLIQYKFGLIIIISCEDHEDLAGTDYITEYVNTNVFPILEIGISSSKLSLINIKANILESISASNMCGLLEQPSVDYNNLGVYKLLIPLMDNQNLIDYSTNILSPLEDYDVEFNGTLLYTVLTIPKCKGTIKSLALTLNQHENTLRYRFKKIKELIGLDYFDQEDYLQLSIAAKIYLLNRTF